MTSTSSTPRNSNFNSPQYRADSRTSSISQPSNPPRTPPGYHYPSSLRYRSRSSYRKFRRQQRHEEVTSYPYRKNNNLYRSDMVDCAKSEYGNSRQSYLNKDGWRTNRLDNPHGCRRPQQSQEQLFHSFIQDRRSEKLVTDSLRTWETGGSQMVGNGGHGMDRSIHASQTPSRIENQSLPPPQSWEAADRDTRYAPAVPKCNQLKKKPCFRSGGDFWRHELYRD